MSTDQRQVPPPAKDADTAPGGSAKPAPSAGMVPQGDLQPDAGGPDELHGADHITEDAVANAHLFAAESRTLDAASRVFGLQTNQQINVLGMSKPQAPPYRTTPLSADTLARVRTAFVRSDDYTNLWNRLLDESLVVLRGSPGSGREHIATHGLDAHCDGHVDHLTGGTLIDLDPGDLAEDAGYLWTGIAEVASGAVEIAHAERLVTALRGRHASMIIVWPEGARWPFQLDRLRYTLQHPLDLAKILRSHLQADVDEHRSAAADLLNDPKVVEAQNGLGGAEQAAQLGRALHDVLLGRCSLADALATAQGTTTDWFARLPEREDRAFALSLVALDGLSYPTVVAGARQLDELIQQAEDPEGQSFIRVTGRPARQLLAAVEAVRAPDLAETAYGDVPVMSVRSQRRNFSRDMLHSLWHDFPYLQELYLHWLAEVVRDADSYVGDRAAVVTGILAQGDFDFVRGRVLDGWARSDQRKVRRAAGIALRAPVLSDELRDVVWELVDDWARADGPVRSPQYFRRLTAATALGGPVGATDCGRALAIITQRLLDRRPDQSAYRLWAATMTAVADIFGDGGSAQSAAVLDQMGVWAAEKDLAPRSLAVAALVGIVARPPREGYQDGRRLAPVLRAVETDRGNLDRIAGLWRLAFNDRVMSKASIDVLRRLAQHVDDTGGENLLMELFRRLPETERERRTLKYEVRQWAAPDSHSKVFSHLLDVLSNREVTR